MTKDNDEKANAGADDRRNHKENSTRENDGEESNAGETDADDTKRFERSDNLRRRSEWFQKRTGGR